ncbi:MAG TPA: hybrid sensor histidine kinase/response regulator [Nitrospirota bacterium]|nr:hybrid sensor histidine kinase/response regulator [Nitrospirota bacterium]
MAGSSDKSGIIEFFLIEAGDHLQNLNKGLLSLEKNPADTAMIDELFRAAHTLKGSAAMMGFQGISDVAHKAEDMLGQFRSGTIPICKESLNFLFDSVDAVKLMVDSVAVSEPEDTLVVESIARAYKDVIGSFQASAPLSTQSDELSSLKEDDVELAWENSVNIEEESIPVEPLDGMENEAVSAQASLESKQFLAAPRDDSSLKQELEEAKKTGTFEKRSVGRRVTDTAEVEKQFIRVSIERLDNLMNLVGEMIVSRNRLAHQVDFIKLLREELSFSQKRLLHEIKKFEEKYEYTMSVETPSANQPMVDNPSDFLELEFDRYDDFNLLSRKLAEITNDTNEIMNELAGFFDSFELDTARISTITTNLQDEITLARMVEMDKLYQMFQRPVRDLAQEENKQVNVVVSGGETKIDKTIFEIISDPLMHMIRNAVSHGIEPAAERKALGKDPTGLLIMKARHEGNSIIIEIEDDGRGMDPAILRNTALEKGFLSKTEAQALTDSEVINLIFRPGFSTATKIGKVSGRGVGMDVVSSQLVRINGRIEIKTEKGVGTKFLIRLPLTLTIAQALIVKLKDQEIAIPMNMVEETTRFSFRDIQRAAGEDMVNLRGTLIKLIKLNELLGVGKFPEKEGTFRHPALILGTAEKRIALMVEDIVGREEIVVKSLGDYLKGIKLFSGATISGDGNVRLIINIATLVGDEATVASKAKIGTFQEEPLPELSTRKPRILVVDDSISIRKYVQRFLDRTGYEVEVAPDGMEALNIMGRVQFDAVIADLEMPVMHGYDLMVEMKKNPELMNIPIIVLTSRAGEKHRQKAMDMGAQDYLVKPFEEQEMLGVLKKLLRGAEIANRA